MATADSTRATCHCHQQPHRFRRAVRHSPSQLGLMLRDRFARIGNLASQRIFSAA
jgi:hypothetical protein